MSPAVGCIWRSPSRHRLSAEISTRHWTRRATPAGTSWTPNAAPNWVIVDEADRLKTAGLEQLRDFFDRRDLGLILIGMPGFDRQLARYPQLYSRIGFAHQYKPLDADDLPLVLANYWHQLGLLLDPGDANDVETISAIIRITGGNFRLIERLMTQVARVMEINQLDTLDPDVIHAARQMLVVGTN